MNSKSEIKVVNILQNHIKNIYDLSQSWNGDFENLDSFFKSQNINSSYDIDIIKPYFKDWSNMEGFADLLVRPKNNIECAIILKTCYTCNILLTVSAGKTNLTGSATPRGGVILSTSLMTEPNIKLDLNNKDASSPVGIPLETFRNKVLELSNHALYYPADPTSRNDAFVGGTLSTNASGFVPGEKGATRYWVKEIEFLLPNGDLIDIKRGQYISNNGVFTLEYDDKSIQLTIPTYKRPKIKNASGLYSDVNGKVDLIDLIIGSEGILGIITSCRLGLDNNPKNKLELFISLQNESEAIHFHDFLNNYLNDDLSQITAMEYFGYNSQNYMNHKEFLFSNEDDVGIYLQIPIYNESMDSKIEEWTKIFQSFNAEIDLDKIIVLNDPGNWNKFFEARHSIPDNALTKTQRLGGVSIITDTIVPKDKFRLYLEKVHTKLKKSNIEYLLFGHLGDCHLHFHLIPTKKQEKESLKIYDYLIDLSSKLGGVYSAEHGTGKRKRNDFKKCYGTEAVEMVKKLKNTIDPNNYLNRGNLISYN
ncbi:MAG: FAD-binding oxidoreductase [Candidatus Neomarinimicrobiota bacterium]